MEENKIPSQDSVPKSSRLGDKLIIFGALAVGVIYLMVLAPEWVEWFAGSPKLNTANVKSNMRICQLAAVDYAKDHQGVYPKSANDSAFKTYFPGGHRPNTPGNPPINPFTGKPEWPVEGSITDVTFARAETSGLIGKGLVEYSAICDKEGKPTSFAIRGGDMSGHAILGLHGKVLVLSDQ